MLNAGYGGYGSYGSYGSYGDSDECLILVMVVMGQMLNVEFWLW